MTYVPQDRYFKKAKQEGYRSRSAYKLIELQQRLHLLRAGDAVVDLGAAPGGWLQVAANIVGQNGNLIGVDLQPIKPLNQHSIVIIEGDITAVEVQAKIKGMLRRHADCVLSDLSPKLSGIRDADTARCLELNQAALRVAVELLKPGGVFLIKSFIGDELKRFTEELKRYFSSVQRIKPGATRQGSSELYFCAKGFNAASSMAH